MVSPRGSPERSWLDPICAGLALAVPLWVTVLRLGWLPQWRDDLALVRGVGLVPAGGEGTVSAVLTQLAALLPVGGLSLRAALVGAVGAAVAARLLYSLARDLLAANAHAPFLTPALALAAALMTTLGPTWQLEATAAGGATVAAALVLGVLLLCSRAPAGDVGAFGACGVLLGFTASESRVGALLLLAALVARAAAIRSLPSRRAVLAFSLGAAAALAVCAVPLLLRPFADRGWIDLGSSVSVGDLVTAAAVRLEGALNAWFRELGMVSLGLAVGGAAWGVASGRLRALVLPFATFAAADLLLPSGEPLLAAEPLAPLRLLGLAGLATSAVLAVHIAARLLVRARLPLAREAAVLLVAFTATLVLVTVDQSETVAEGRVRHGAQAWTDAALDDLPPNSLLLVRSRAVTWRLWAARAARGSRPDVVVVPVSLLHRSAVAASLLAIEPELAALIRDLAINGQPSEHALSRLADARPLFLELDPAWDSRLMKHLSPRPLWLGFAPHALGRSDRKAALEAGRAGFRRVLAAAERSVPPDAATLAVLGARAQEQALVLAALGDRASVKGVLRDLRRIDPDAGIIEELEGRLEEKRRGGIEVADLLR